MGRCRYKKPSPVMTAALAYIVGVITTDGNLSSDRRHINITSKDVEMVLTIKRLLNLQDKIIKKSRGGSKEKKYFVLQFSDVVLYDFLLGIGLMPAKSKILENILIPDEFFADFLRGCIDGDGSIDFFMHPESKLPQYRVRLVSASPLFLQWVLEQSRALANLSGGSIYQQREKSVGILSFAKEDSRKILKFMYYKSSLPSLSRKRKVAQQLLRAGGGTR